jgi:hypothetical protein
MDMLILTLKREKNYAYRTFSVKNHNINRYNYSNIYPEK